MEDCAERKRRAKTIMKIKLIPDARNEEKIADIKHALETLEDDALEEYFCEKVCEGEEWFDAMYYAAKDRGNETIHHVST